MKCPCGQVSEELPWFGAVQGRPALLLFFPSFLIPFPALYFPWVLVIFPSPPAFPSQGIWAVSIASPWISDELIPGWVIVMVYSVRVLLCCWCACYTVCSDLCWRLGRVRQFNPALMCTRVRWNIDSGPTRQVGRARCRRRGWLECCLNLQTLNGIRIRSFTFWHMWLLTSFL